MADVAALDAEVAAPDALFAADVDEFDAFVAEPAAPEADDDAFSAWVVATAA